MQNGIDYTGASVIELTQAEYDALPSSKYSDGITYMIKDRYSANATKMLGVGDCYSTSEKIVGCWVDGKPLYQKSFKIANIVHDSSWHRIPHGISDLDVVVSVSGIMINETEREMFPVTAYRPTLTQGIIVGCGGTNGDSIMYINNWYNSPNTDLYITFQYTKTTDVAGSGDWTPSGVSAVHYDDTEKIVGTFFGATLYERTVHYTGTINANTTVTIADVTSWSISKVVSILGTIKESGWGTVEMPCKEGRLQISDGSTKNLTLVMGNIGFSPADAYITVQYTKS